MSPARPPLASPGSDRARPGRREALAPAAWTLACALALGPAAAAAQGAPFGGLAEAGGGPVEVTAEALSIDRATGVAVFEGGVVVGQGTGEGALRLAAERVEVEYGEDRRIARLTATGGVTVTSGGDAAEARQAVYAVEAGEIVMTGDVLLTQSGAQSGAQGAAQGAALSADRLRVDLASGRAELEGRVRTVLPAGD